MLNIANLFVPVQGDLLFIRYLIYSRPTAKSHITEDQCTKLIEPYECLWRAIPEGSHVHLYI